MLQDFHARFQRTGKPYRKLDGNQVSEDSLQVCAGILAFVVIIGPKCQFLGCRLLDNMPGHHAGLSDSANDHPFCSRIHGV